MTILGRPSEAPALVKHAVRFARRLRQRDIYNSPCHRCSMTVATFSRSRSAGAW
jgi:hypothetical protein